MSDVTTNLPANVNPDSPLSENVGGTGKSNALGNTLEIKVGPISLTAASSAGSTLTLPGSGVVQAAPLNDTYANSVVRNSATPTATAPAVLGAISNTATPVTGGGLIGVTGQASLPSAKSITGGFLYGTYGLATLPGILNGGSVAGLRGQLDISNSTLTAGNMACVWADAGTSGPTQTFAGFNMFRATNTTNTTANAHFSAYGKASFFFDGQLNGSAWYATSGTSAGSAGDTSKCNAPKVLKIQVDGVAGFVPVFLQNT